MKLKQDYKAMLLPFFIMLLCLASGCKKELGVKEIKETSVEVSLKLPAKYEVEEAEFMPVAVTVKLQHVMLPHLSYEVTVEQYDGSEPIVVPNVQEGIYDISCKASFSFKDKGEQGLRRISTRLYEQRGVAVRYYKESKFKNQCSLSYEPSIKNTRSTSSFVIAEIGFKATENNGVGQYLIVANNSHETLYADSLLVVEGAYQTLKGYAPSFSSVVRSSLPIHRAYLLPGSGKQYPIEPGSVMVLNTDKLVKFVDSEEVANELGFFSDNGTRVLALARTKLTKEAFGKKFTHTNPSPTDKTPKTFFTLPNNCIFDAVVLSLPQDGDGDVKNAISSDLDKGYTGWSSAIDEMPKAGTILKRKMRQGVKDEKVYQDSNNSTLDFELAK